VSERDLQVHEPGESPAAITTQPLVSAANTAVAIGLGVDQRHTAKERGEQRKQHQLTYSGVHALMVSRCRRSVKERGRAPDPP
jgi:hypothetical protein